jgi:hypothetical protein
MKTILKLVAACAFVGGVVGCESICSKYCEDAVQNEQEESATAESKISMDTVPGTMDFNQSLAYGALSTGLTEDGYNICVQNDGFAVYFQLLKISGGQVKGTNPIALKDGQGFEISLVDNGGSLELNVAVQANPFPYNVKLKGENIKKLALGGSDPRKFDVKVSRSCPAIGSGGNNPPALIGGNDARDGNYTTSSAMIADLSHGRAIRLHAEHYTGGVDVVFSADSISLKKFGSLKFDKMGVPFWGCGMDKEHK